ncbi:MAG: fumarate hydratase C-terminal domain-containing protein [Candidatus Marinimicrobia bacterium]|nr:fumarate hydratase C-terminal domain-containing protein [Candidatus Neomarinimicrobiota bacterium]
MPLSSLEIREMRIGEELLLSGRIITGRDRAHRWMLEERPDAARAPYLKNGSDLSLRTDNASRNGKWECRAAGPTTSMREESYQADIIQEYKLRCVIGKGGMGERTAEALQNSAAVYMSAVGGAAVFYARKIVSVEDVIRLESFGMPEAMWVLQVRDFPVIVSMDAFGNSLHRDVEDKSRDSLPPVLQSNKKEILIFCCLMQGIQGPEKSCRRDFSPLS